MSRGTDLLRSRLAHTSKYGRRLIAGTAGAILAAGLLAAAETSASTPKAATPSVAVTVGRSAVGPGIAPGFVGVATEFWNVLAEVGTDPRKPDTAFEQVVRNLSPDGGLSLRIGGDSTDWTWFPIPGMSTPPWVRWTMTPTWAAVTKRLVSDLHAHLIVGLNMEAQSVKIAEAELQEIQTQVGGSAPITFELGNEPELYDHFPYYHTASGAVVLGRPKNYSLPEMSAQWNQLANGLPHVRLAGPGFSGLSALPFIGQFLGSTHRLSVLTVHTYPLKSTRCTGGAPPQESELFDPHSLQDLASGLNAWTTEAHHHGVGVRVDEMNSVTCGGQPGFTGTFGPALWMLNILPLYAADGVNGVNIQTRPNTAQNLIQTNFTTAGWRVVVQPEYYGLLTFAKLTPPGSRILQVSATKPGLLAWAVRTPQGQTHVVVTNINPSAVPVAIRAPGTPGQATEEALSAPGGLTASHGVTLGGQSIYPTTGQLIGRPLTSIVHPTAGAYDITVPPATAEILTFRS